MRRTTNNEPAPWIALGMSRATWYRLGQPEKKPQRMTQTQIADKFAVSVRSLQRARRVLRDAPDLAAQVEAGSLTTGTAERIVVKRQAEEALAWLRQLRATSFRGR